MMFTVQRITNPKSDTFDLGFALQALYGSDARYLHYLGELDKLMHTRYQLAVLQANLSVHLPWLVQGGIDVKLGQYPSPLGFEALDPASAPFYSHSYIWNFGLPGGHTGVLATAHMSDMVDVWTGLDTGSSTSFGKGDNNGRPAGIIGFGLNGLLDGKLTALALTHLGPELPVRSDPHANRTMRYYNDLVSSYKASETLSLNAELNYVYDTGLRASAYGMALYASYNVDETWIINFRTEGWRDDLGAFAAAYPSNSGPAKALIGDLGGTISARPATYAETTLGVTYKQPVPGLNALQIRPELRLDRAFGGSRPFSAGRDRGAFTASVDITTGF